MRFAVFLEYMDLVKKLNQAKSKIKKHKGVFENSSLNFFNILHLSLGFSPLFAMCSSHHLLVSVSKHSYWCLCFFNLLFIAQGHYLQKKSSCIRNTFASFYPRLIGPLPIITFKTAINLALHHKQKSKEKT